MTVLPFETVTANPVFTFVVNVKNEDGSAGKDDLKITIKNESRDLKGNGLLGQPEAVSDNCPVTFIDLEDGLKVADIGDQTTIEVRFSQGKLLAPTTYQITASDVADARSVVDIRIEAVNIESVSISAEIAKSGDTLVFSMVGTLGKQAAVSLAGVFRNLKVEEKSAREYTTSYTVKDGDNASEVPIVFQLSAQRNSKETITIDTLGLPQTNPTTGRLEGKSI